MSMKIGDVKKVLIPTDGSAYSVRAAELGISLSKQVGAEVIVIYVIDSVVVEQMARMGEKEKLEKELEEDGQRYLRYIQGLAEREGVKATTFLLKGIPFEQIIHLAKSLQVNLIVMGTYGRRGADRILIGSVSERVIEYAPCPVLVVK
jgi:nucleotide-binding universal stress UspA family protein